MTILGLGADIIEIIRIKLSIVRNGDRLAKRILSQNELKIWKKKQSIRFLAKHFAVKEAAAKALGIGIRNGLAFNQFELFNDKLGKPYLRLSDTALKIAEKFGNIRIHVTITDERCYAYAIVIIEKLN